MPSRNRSEKACEPASLSPKETGPAWLADLSDMIRLTPRFRALPITPRSVKPAGSPKKSSIESCKDRAASGDLKRNNRDRGEPRGSAPPTPPDIRVRIRRFGGLSRPQFGDGAEAE